MKFSTWTAIAVAALSTIVGAATMPLSEVPNCGITCALKTVGASECKSLANTACICNSQKLVADLGSCVLSTCTIPEALAMQKFSDVLCDKPRVDNSLPAKIIAPLFISIAVLCFCVRVLARWQHGLRASWRPDDWLIVPAVAGLVALFIVCHMVAYNGLGLDMWWLKPAEISYVLYWYFWAEIVYVWIVSWSKISVVTFYLQIFPNRRFRYANFLLIFCNVGYMIALIVVTVFQCDPVPGAWLAWDKLYQAKCVNINAVVWASALSSIVLDSAMLVLPMPMLWKLNMTTKKKLHVMFMFSLGLFVTIVSIIRLQSIEKFAKTTNATQDFLAVGIWSIVECCVGVICACLPAMRAVFAKLAPKAFASTAAHTGAGLGSGMPGRRTGGDKANSHSASQVAGSSSKNYTTTSTITTTSNQDRDSSRIQVKSEFTVRSRRRDEKSFVELDDLTSIRSERAESIMEFGNSSRSHVSQDGGGNGGGYGKNSSTVTVADGSNFRLEPFSVTTEGGDGMSHIERSASSYRMSPVPEDRGGYIGRADPRHRSTYQV